MNSPTYDLIVIGGGSGGLVCAAGGAGLGAKVALIEKKKLGGDCLNTGCVPSKALIRSAKIIHTLKKAKAYGIKDCHFQFEFSDIMNRVKAIQKQLEPHDSPERFRSLGVDVKFGNYTFKNSHELTNGEETIRGKRIVIATGSSPFVPPIPGCEEHKCLTSDNIWNLTTLPKRLAVIGGGPIGSEMAQAFGRFGSQVTLIDLAHGILPREDADLKDYVQNAFLEDGIQFRFNAQLKKVNHGHSSHVVTFESQGKEETLECDEIFVAVGRKPNMAGLDLEKGGIATDKRGIVINEYCQTSLPHVYACGDVAGPYQFTHFADYQARLILRNALFPGKTKADYRVVPWCTYTDPELARVGLSQTEAKQKNIPHDVFTYDLSDLDRAVCDSEGQGLVKVITHKGKDTLLGLIKHTGRLYSFSVPYKTMKVSFSRPDS
ncbi:MAG: FAD-dependent oxidoreductase [Deltaproteobacteria bacterium]|nr:FAD-dependent oxidoreductase [Deltaproteobacteria bacterium]